MRGSRDGRGVVWHGKMEHFCDARHLGVVELVPGSLEHGLGCNAAKMVFKDELAGKGGTFLGGASAVDYHIESVSVGRVTRDVNILS